jgi:hypothetical protein
VESIKRFLSNCQSRLMPWLSSAMGWLFVIYLSATMLIKYDTETTNISGAVFVVLSVIAGLAFTYAGVLPDRSRDRTDVIYAGEHLFQGSMIFLATSLLKHGTIVIPTQVAALSTWPAVHFEDKIDIGPLVFLLQITLFLIFVSGLLVAQLGYKILGQVVIRRLSQGKRGGGYFPPEE